VFPALPSCSRVQFPEDVEATALIEQSRAAHQRLLDALGQELRTSGVETSLHLAVGHAAQQILVAAGELAVDLIVLGSRERHGLSLLVDFTEDSVLHKAPCDVLAVRVKPPA